MAKNNKKNRKETLLSGMRNFLKIIVTALVGMEVFCLLTGLGAAFPELFKANYLLVGTLAILLIGIVIGYLGHKNPKTKKNKENNASDDDDDD